MSLFYRIRMPGRNFHGSFTVPPGARRMGSKGGLTMIEIVVALAVIIVLAASLTPSVAGIVDRQRVLAAKSSLEGLVASMSSMRGDNQDWPGRLSHLTEPITVSDK